MTTYDLVIIGSGPGGYVSALYASRHKLKVCVIEKDLVGGTCLNRGCIPTKSLLNSASIISAINNAAVHGIDIGKPGINFPKMVSRKNEMVLRLRTGIETLFRSGNIELMRGAAMIEAPDKVSIDGKAGCVGAKNIIIASGSRTAALANIAVDEVDILTSDGMLEIEELPGSLIIIGGGVIGCEFATLFNLLGVKVTIIEFMDRLIPAHSREISKKLELIFKKRGIDVFLSSKAESIVKKGGLRVSITGGKELTAEKILVSIGRLPVTGDLGLERLKIRTVNGRIEVDENLRTAEKNIYAIGDCVNGPLLAHKASYDGILACDNILGDLRKADYTNIPNCIWTEPEIASVGLSEDEARARYPEARTAKFPYIASGKAFLMGKTEGFIKIIGDPKGKILGVEIFGAGACELIGEATLARTAGISIKDWARTVHGHPTLSEVLQEAAHIFCGAGIHTI